MRKTALFIGALAAVSFFACMETGPDAPPRQNGCIYLGCEVEGGDNDAAPEGGGATDAPVGMRDPLEGSSRVATLVKNGFQFTEGPVWLGDKLLFSDTTANTIFTLSGTTSTPFRTNSNAANGNALTADNKLVTCEGGLHRVVKSDLVGGAPVSVADTFNAKKLNSPNDVIVRTDGTIYFTDPNYGGVDGASNQLPFEGAYRIPAAGGAPVRLDGTFVRANGIALSPTQSTLYVVDNGGNALYSAALDTDGTNGAFTKLVPDAQGGDGMAVDDDGNLYIACTDGVRVYTPSGTMRGTITVAEQPSNCSFGGTDRRTLFITARTGVYSIVLGVPGLA